MNREKLRENVAVVVIVYTIGLPIVVGVFILTCLGVIKVENPEDRPALEPGMWILPNHNDVWDCMAEVFITPALFFRQWLLHPLTLLPWFTPDGRNFTDNPGWAWLRARAVPIQREKDGETNRTIREARGMVRVLTVLKAVLVHFFEGGRTCTFKGKLLRSKRGKALRPVKPSVGWVWKHSKAKVVLVRIENGEAPQRPGKKLFSWPNFRRGRVIIRFGKPMEFSADLESKSPTDLAKMIEDASLSLADDTNK